MFTRFASLLSIAALAAVVAGTGTTNECTTGALHCCNSVTTTQNPTTNVILEFFGVNTGSVSGIVGLTCSGNVGSSTSCTQEPVCCNGNNFNGGLAVIGCSPIG